ncbi:hypothetical protein G7054_g11974 [Neopestalotiopsis clavispora]|nr:hypothetical protein G7054_g11974 [Neopestalotiopsis clavispora]
MDQLQVDALHKIVTGDITKASLGLASSGLQALFLPWQTIPACLNAAKLIKSTSRLHQLEKTVKASSGLRLRKRATIRGILRGAVVKGVTIVLFVGHDDVLGIFDQATGLMSYFGANDDGGSEGVTSSMRDYFDSWDQDHRMGHPVIEGSTAVASLPAETIQDMLGLDTASDQGLSHTGWHAGGGAVVQQVVVVGAAQVAAEKFIETPVEHALQGREKKKSSDRH